MQRSVGILVTVASLLAFSPCHGSVIRVPSDQPTIQAGVDAAVDGDIVLLADGTYAGPGNVGIELGGKTIRVLGEGGASSTVVDCGDTTYAFWFDDGDTVSLEGLTITGGSGVRCYRACSPTFERCVFRECRSSVGGAVYRTSGGSLQLVDCTFEGNSAHQAGAVCVYGGDLVVTGCSFLGNETESYGAALYLYQGEYEIQSSYFEGNVAAQEGGAIYLSDCTLLVSGCSFVDCSAGEGGGAISCRLDGAGVAAEYCVFAGNEAGEWGGALRMSFSSSNRILRSTFFRNRAPSGAAVSAVGSSAPPIGRSILAENAGGHAVQRYHPQETVPLTYCCLYRNEAGDDVYFGDEDVMLADPLFCAPDVGNFTVATFSQCVAEHNDWGQDVGALGAGCEPAVSGRCMIDGVVVPGETEAHILVSLDRVDRVSARIYDLEGREVATLVDSEFMAQGVSRIAWDLRTEDGWKVTCGTYLCVVNVGDHVTRGRIAVLTD
jgi:predicted outer membrane repeat protein